MDNIWANFLRKDPVTRSINRKHDKRVKQARKNLKEVKRILEV